MHVLLNCLELHAYVCLFTSINGIKGDYRNEKVTFNLLPLFTYVLVLVTPFLFLVTGVVGRISFIDKNPTYV